MSKIEDFMAKLAQQQPKSRGDFKSNKTRVLEKVYLNFQGNFGRYQVLPISSSVTDHPFVTLFGTREVQIPRKNMGVDGSENIYKAWIKLLPKEAYVMKEPGTGRVVSSLSAEDENLLSQAYMLYDQLYAELEAKENREEHVISLIRSRNYTIFHGYCMNHWGNDNPRTPVRTGFSGLFVVTAKSFISAVQGNIDETSLTEGGDLSWIDQVYNNQMSGRTGFLMFSVNNNPTQAGYLVTATHKIGAGNALSGVTIPTEDAELMQDPVGSFLGWQAARSNDVPVNEKRHFNSTLIKETIDFMSNQLTAIRMAKQSNVSIADAIARTTKAALSQQTPTNSMGQPTNDPVLAVVSQQVVVDVPIVNPDAVLRRNMDPYGTPPVAHIDPISSAPIDQNPGFGGSTFQKPAFATGFESNGGNDDLPF